MKRIAKVLDIDGQFREAPDFPVAVVREKHESESGTTLEAAIVDPVFNSSVTRNLFGRMMTLVEATCETHKLKAVKDLFAKELREWENDVYDSARRLVPVEGGDKAVYADNNIYTKY